MAASTAASTTRRQRGRDQVRFIVLPYASPEGVSGNGRRSSLVGYPGSFGWQPRFRPLGAAKSTNVEIILQEIRKRTN
jgi:hypothetical protein